MQASNGSATIDFFEGGKNACAYIPKATTDLVTKLGGNKSLIH
jgi:hypothetical protein